MHIQLQQQGAQRSLGSGCSGGGREPVSNVVADREEPRSDLSVGGGVRPRSGTSPAHRRPRGPEVELSVAQQLLVM